MIKPIDLACIIDDDPIFVYGTKTLMELANFCKNFLVYQNGEEALKALVNLIESKSVMPDVILLDINMPIMDGWEFLDHIIKVPTEKSLTIYVISSSINPVDIQRAKSYSQVSNYLIKPMTIATLQQMMSELAPNM
ncbi:Response regulator receiver domain-containing protein [Pustulibacterium marinum]|uniref:Response regulator receiver domain-containing protein n=1 Tax=Pustulibacterium marinum TaxID=1224947 RepID=A0A1I7IMW5_9FLAO|nr:response regulator [Pustulibacterium marinum]SFU74281.1 Response regulator receiver domain-containing protein [Pustulibacterium marinum]